MMNKKAEAVMFLLFSMEQSCTTRTEILFGFREQICYTFMYRNNT